MGGIYGGKDIRPISQKQDSLHGLINTILDKLPLGVFVKVSGICIGTASWKK